MHFLSSAFHLLEDHVVLGWSWGELPGHEENYMYLIMYIGVPTYVVWILHQLDLHVHVHSSILEGGQW